MYYGNLSLTKLSGINDIVKGWFGGNKQTAAAPAITPKPIAPAFKAPSMGLNTEVPHNWVEAPPGARLNLLNKISPPEIGVTSGPGYKSITPGEDADSDVIDTGKLAVGPKWPEMAIAGAYKQQYYGNQLLPEMQKAHAYNVANNLPGNQNNWARPTPITTGGNGPSYNDPISSQIREQSYGNGSFDPGKAEAAPNPNINLLNPAYHKLLTQEVSSNPEKYGFKSNQIQSFLDPREFLEHEMRHSGLQDQNVEAYDRSNLVSERPIYKPISSVSYGNGNERIVEPTEFGPAMPDSTSFSFGNREMSNLAGSGHDTLSGEMRNYLSGIQEQQFQQNGKRFETPEEYDKFYNGLGVEQPDTNQFESNIKKLPIDSQRMFRRMRAIQPKFPNEYNDIKNWQRTIVPGIVQNQQSNNFKTASLFGDLSLTKLADALQSSTPYQGLNAANTIGSYPSTAGSIAEKAIQYGSKLPQELSEMAPVAKTLSGLGAASPFLKRALPPLAIANAGEELARVSLYPDKSHSDYMSDISDKGPIGRAYKGFNSPFSALHAYSQEAQNGAQLAGENTGSVGKGMYNAVNSQFVKNTPALEPLRQAANTGMSLANYFNPAAQSIGNMASKGVQSALSTARGVMTSSELPQPNLSPKPQPPMPSATKPEHLFGRPAPTPVPHVAQFGKQAPSAGTSAAPTPTPANKQ